MANKKKTKNISDYRGQIDESIDFYHNFEFLVSNLDNVFWIGRLDKNFKIEYVSPSFKKIWGVEPSMLYNHSGIWMDKVYEEDKDFVKKRFEDFLKGKSSFDVTFRIKNSSGNIRWIKNNSRRIKDYKNKTIKFIGIATDVTDIKILEENESELKKRYKFALDSGNLGVWDLDLTNDVLVWDETMYNLYGVKKAKKNLAYSYWKKSVSKEDMKRADEEVMSAIKGKKDFNTKFSVVWPDKSIHLLEAHAIVIRDLNGKAVRMIGINKEITSEEKLKQDLINESKRLNYILEGTNLGTWEWNVQNGETKFNERWAEIIGYKLKELGKISIKTWQKFCHPEDLKRSDRILKDHFDKKIPFYDVILRMKHKKGHWVFVHDRGKVFDWTKDGKPIWMYGTHQEVPSA